jgi:hypothetical protein
MACKNAVRRARNKIGIVMWPLEKLRFWLTENGILFIKGHHFMGL